MAQKNKVLTREESRISVIATRRTTVQEDCPAITGRKTPATTIEQTWVFEVGEKTRVGRTTPKLMNTAARIAKWLSRVWGGRIDDSYLEARHNIHHNFRINGMRL